MRERALRGWQTEGGKSGHRKVRGSDYSEQIVVQATALFFNHLVLSASLLLHSRALIWKNRPGQSQPNDELPSYFHVSSLPLIQCRWSELQTPSWSPDDLKRVIAELQNSKKRRGKNTWLLGAGGKQKSANVFLIRLFPAPSIWW